MNNKIRSISNKMHERGLSSDKQEFGSFYLLRFLGAEINFEPNKCIVSLESVKFLIVNKNLSLSSPSF